MSVSLSLKLAEIPQNETIFDRIVGELIVSQNSRHLEYKYRAIDVGTCYPRLGTFYSRLGTCYPRHFRWTRAIFVGPAPFLLTRDPRHIDYPEIPMQR